MQANRTNDDDLNSDRIHRALAERDPQIVLVDYFDTLVTRTVGRRQLKPVMARHLSDSLGLEVGWQQLLAARLEAETIVGARLQARGLDPEHRIDEVGAEMWRQLGRAVPGDRAPLPSTAEPFIAAVTAVELAVERAVQQVDHDVLDVLKAEVGRRRLVVVSDFHLPSPWFQQMLDAHGLGELFEAIYVSCDHSLSKRSGRLYSHVLDELALRAPVPRSQILMVGDHPVSDIEQARAAGLAACPITRLDPETGTVSAVGARVKRRTEGTAVRRRFSARARRRTVQESIDGSRPSPFAEMAVTLYAFTARLWAMARSDEVDVLAFQAREGQLLKALFDRYQALVPSAAAAPIETRYLVVSRRSTILAGLAPIGEETFHSLTSGYPDLTLDDLVGSLGLEPQLARAVGDELGVDPEAPVDIEQLRGSDAFRQRYMEARSEQGALLTTYVDGIVGQPGAPLHLVDVGWKGTIQDHLQRALGAERAVTGYYLGVVSPADQPYDETKQAVLFDSRRPSESSYHQLRHFKSLYEHLFQADHGSAARYKQRDDGGVEPELDAQERELEQFERVIQPIQAGLVTVFTELCRADAVRTDPLLPSLDEVARHHSRMLYFPRRDELDIIRSLHWYENYGWMGYYGAGGSDRAREARGQRLRALAGLARRPRSLLGASWPPLTLDEAGLAALIPVLGAGRRARDLLRGWGRSGEPT